MIYIKAIKTVLLSLIGLALLLIGASSIYENLNTGRYIGGHGYMVVASCRADGHSFRCNGEFSQYGGMITVLHTSMITDRTFPSGQRVEDVYATYTRRDAGGDPAEATLITGSERRSFEHNLGNIGFIIIGAICMGGFPLWEAYKKHLSKR